MDQIVIAQKDRHAAVILDLFVEYLNWGTSRLEQEFNIKFPVEETVAQDKAGLDKFMPPKGRALLAYVGESPVGVACLKELAGTTGEVKRMYVKPGFRGHGLGKALLQRLLDEATGIGYINLKLDSARFMTEAHHLYRSMGFAEIEPYEGSEIPKEFQSHWIFMEKFL